MFFDPPLTGPMTIRWAQGKLTGKTTFPNKYWWIDLKSAPTNFVVAVWIMEDQRFFLHWGFDWEQIQQARADTLASGQPARGASTITQQCARSLFLWQGRSWFRKGLEAYYTLWMELLLSKDRILELYVNVIEFGDGVYGVEAGAQLHFHVSAAKLTREQCALLVAIMPNPKVWDPNSPNERVLKRQAAALERSEYVILPPCSGHTLTVP